MEIYVGNIPFATTGRELEELFARIGRVTGVHLAVDESGPLEGIRFCLDARFRGSRRLPLALYMATGSTVEVCA